MASKLYVLLIKINIYILLAGRLMSVGSSCHNTEGRYSAMTHGVLSIPATLAASTISRPINAMTLHYFST